MININNSIQFFYNFLFALKTGFPTCTIELRLSNMVVVVIQYWSSSFVVIVVVGKRYRYHKVVAETNRDIFIFLVFYDAGGRAMMVVIIEYGFVLSVVIFVGNIY
jgi:hypothetical protein